MFFILVLITRLKIIENQREITDNVLFFEFDKKSVYCYVVYLQIGICGWTFNESIG